MNSNFTVVYDACVLFPAPLRDLLMRLAMTDVFRARWTDRIHEEWMRAVLGIRPDLKRADLERTRTLMNDHVRDCLVTGYEHLIESIELPDPNDRHVVAAAAALRSGASLIVTFNLKDFPKERLRTHNIEAHHPDDFIVDLFDLTPEEVVRAAAEQRRSLRNPPKTVDEFTDLLLKQGLTQTVDKLRGFRWML